MSKKALCVGINKFKHLPSAALNGCVNDAREMKALLKDLLGFTDRSVKVLTDSRATKAAIMKELQAMVDGAKKGLYSYLVFSLSSHGTQVPDTSGDEPDNADEAFCPYDIQSAGDRWHPDHIITDDELNNLFVQLPPNVLLEVYLDTCHSGSGLKSIDMLLDRRPRFLPPPTLDAFLKIEKLPARGLKDMMLKKEIVHHILWSGCKADQTSADANIDGAWHGAFTYYFCKEMRACNNALSRAKVLEKVKADLRAGHYSQIPQLETEATVRGRSVGPAPAK